MATFPTGTKTFFNQASAPTGWTKSTTDTDYTLRIVSGATGGTITNTLGFSTGMVDTALSASVPTVNTSVTSDLADLPAHTHTYTTAYGTSWMAYSFQDYPGGARYPYFTTPLQPAAPGYAATSGSAGTGIAHTHALTVGASSFTTASTASLSVKYLDFILASKN